MINATHVLIQRRLWTIVASSYFADFDPHRTSLRMTHIAAAQH